MLGVYLLLEPISQPVPWCFLFVHGQPGAFDDTFLTSRRPVDAVIHAAAVVTLTGEDPDAVIKPTVQGTVGILESVRQYG